MSTHACYYCGPTEEELRPYGPGGATICFPCMMAVPEREAEAAKNFHTLCEAAGTISGIVGIGSEDGPMPFVPEEKGV